MNLCRFLPRLWLACYAVLWLAAGMVRAEVKVLDRKPVAGGAEVVLELVSDDGPATYYQYSYRAPGGMPQVFYRMVVLLKKADGSVRHEKQWMASRIDELKFDEHRVSLFHSDLDDCVVVTLELDAAAPRVHVDRFSQSYGFGSVHAELVGVDELVLSDPSKRPPFKRLKRAADGTWRLAGIPYEQDVSSDVLALPLLSVAEMLKTEAQAAVKRVSADEGWISLSAISGRDPITTAPNTDLKGLLRISDLDDRPQSIAKLERVLALPGLFSQPRLKAAPAPVLVVGRDTPLPSVFMIPERWADCGWVRMPMQSLMLQHFLRCLDSSRPTASELPCYASEYDRAVNDLCAAYGYCQEYFATRLAKAMHGVDDVAFLDLIETKMEKSSL